MQRQDSFVNSKWMGRSGRFLRSCNAADLSVIIADFLKPLPWLALLMAPAAMAIPLPPLTTSTSGELGTHLGGPHRPMVIVPPSPGGMAVADRVAGPRRPGLITSPSTPGSVASRP
jgi:hypothetical protein